jgi:2-oxoglutarate dehydrogenase complex dehydrogenase (E1) component-like enzyme
VSPSFAEALYRRYRADPQSVDPDWRDYFQALEATVSGPSWARTNWPPSDTDGLTAGLDPTQMEPEAKPAKGAKPAAAPAAPAAAASGADVTAAALDAIRAVTLIRTYRVRGHLLADLDPLGLAHQECPEDLKPEYHGFAEADMDRPIFLGGTLGFERATVREIIAVLRRNYCGKVGLEYMHIQDVEERNFLQERMEGKDKEISFTPEGKKAILAKVIEGEQWEKFLAKKYVGTKRFGLDGGESMIPALEAVLKYGGQHGVQEVVLGMAHRGRLNVLTNVMKKPYRVLFHEFAGGSANPEDVGGSGDVKYHLGTSTDREFDGQKIHLSLAPNPSHLECVDPVVLGKSRAKQTSLQDNERAKVMPILIHGDAAFAGQGIVMLLPHGYEGQGPEHSSARLERYLQLCAEDNIQVANCTTPANYFHILRRQMLRKFRKPLVIMTPKSLLRHKAAVSTIDEFLSDSHFRRILSDPNAPADDKVKRLVLCSGKVFYDLAEARDAAGDTSTTIVRVEQLYPFPSEALTARIAHMPNLETVVWAQEEPKNNGAWFFVECLIEEAIEAAGKSIRPVYAGRKASAATATGLMKNHSKQQAALVAEALGHEQKA